MKWLKAESGWKVTSDLCFGSRFMCLSIHTTYGHLSTCQTSWHWKLANTSISHQYDTILAFLFRFDNLPNGGAVRYWQLTEWRMSCCVTALGASFLLLSTISSSSLKTPIPQDHPVQVSLVGFCLIPNHFLPRELGVFVVIVISLAVSQILVMPVFRFLEGNYNVIWLYPRNQARVAHSGHAINACLVRENESLKYIKI